MTMSYVRLILCALPGKSAFLPISYPVKNYFGFSRSAHTKPGLDWGRLAGDNGHGCRRMLMRIADPPRRRSPVGAWARRVSRTKRPSGITVGAGPFSRLPCCETKTHGESTPCYR
jgi:hypothetical protein